MTPDLLPTRMAAKVRITESGCWEWTAHLSDNGYGAVHWDGRHTRAHRVAYELLVAPIPPGLSIDHLCRNRLCCNPEHLEAVSLVENIRRARVLVTHCKWGHPFSENNTRIESGSRKCRTCDAERHRVQRARLRHP